MPEYKIASQVARQLRDRFDVMILPTDITNCVYRSKVLQDLPVIGGRRVFTDADIEVLVSEMRRAGKLPPLRRRFTREVAAHA